MPARIQHDAAACGAICESPVEPGIGLWSRSTWDPVTALQHKKRNCVCSRAASVLAGSPPANAAHEVGYEAPVSSTVNMLDPSLVHVMVVRATPPHASGWR